MSPRTCATSAAVEVLMFARGANAQEHEHVVSARRYYAQLLEICQRADTPGRSELADARQARVTR